MTIESRNQNDKQMRSSEPPSLAGRVAIESVQPEIDAGAWSPKRIENEPITIKADVYSDGHDIIDCDLLWRRKGDPHWRRDVMRPSENDTWIGHIPAQTLGRLEYTIEAWRDPYATLIVDIKKKLSSNQNVELEILEVLHILEKSEHPSAAQALLKFQAAAQDQQIPFLISNDNMEMMRTCGPREDVSRYKILQINVERKRAAFSAWYEMFPRSAANDGARHGNFRDVIGRLDYVRQLGFDVLYFPPIHPIGSTHRKGRNNALAAETGDHGSVYAIGSEAGGHDSIHPQLGTLSDFRELVAEAEARGLEIALDFAIQCSPDHPWVQQHPDWFSWRPDGSVRFAENPPKKYEDIVNVKFEGAAFPDAWYAWRDIILFWIGNGVRIFRVDNPHTKPLPFWRWLIATINAEHPDVIFLSEAFTRPKMMKRLAKIGFQQSYTYFTWRNAKHELIEYMNELTGPMSEYYRPNFFVNTPDINPYYLQSSGRAGFIIRATLAATLSPSWGIYSGFELCEAAALPGREEYLDSEKYQLRARNFEDMNSISWHISQLNKIRNAFPALQKIGNILFLNAWHDHIIAYAKAAEDRSNIIMVLANLDPHQRHECLYEAPLWEFGLSDFASIDVEDLLLGGRFQLHEKTHHINLDPAHNPVVIWSLTKPQLAAGRAP